MGTPPLSELAMVRMKLNLEARLVRMPPPELRAYNPFEELVVDLLGTWARAGGRSVLSGKPANALAMVSDVVHRRIVPVTSREAARLDQDPALRRRAVEASFGRVAVAAPIAPEPPKEPEPEPETETEAEPELELEPEPVPEPVPAPVQPPASAPAARLLHEEYIRGPRLTRSGRTFG